MPAATPWRRVAALVLSTALLGPLLPGAAGASTAPATVDTVQAAVGPLLPRYLGEVSAPGGVAPLYPAGGVTLDDGTRLIADSGGSRVVSMAPDGTITELPDHGYNDPRDIDLDPDGTAWVMDTGNNRVVHITTSGALLGTIGDAARLEIPYGIAVDATGVYIADTYANRVVKFSKADSVLWAANTVPGGEPANMSRPRDVGLGSDGNVYVADTDRGRIAVFDPDGGFVRSFGRIGTAAGEFRSPRAVTSDGAGGVWVADAFNYRVQHLTDTGTFLGASFGEFGTGDDEYRSPHCVFMDGDHVAVCDTFGFRIQRYTVDGAGRPVWDSVLVGGNPADGGFNGPFASAYGPDGELFVVDWFNHRVQKFHPDGSFALAFGGYGTGANSPNMIFPRGILVSPDGQVVVTDSENNRIALYDLDGTFVRSIRPPSTSPLSRPNQTALAHDGSYWLVDTNNDRVVHLGPTGALLHQWDNGRTIKLPQGIAVDAAGDVYVSNTSRDRVEKYSPEGVLLATLATVGAANGRVNAPAGLLITGTGTNALLWVADAGNDRIQVLTLDGTFVTSFGSTGSGPGQLDNPKAVAVRRNGTVAVADHFNDRMSIWSVGDLGAGEYAAVQPERLLDTRTGSAVGYSGPKPGADAVVELQVTGAGASQLPADTAAVVLNVTGTEADADGYVTVWPCGTPRPTASNLNLTAGTTSPNLVISKVGTGGRVCLYTQSPTHLIADLDGHFPATSTFVAVQPERLLDTRAGDQVGYVGAEPGADAVVELQVTGAGASQLPADTAAVVLNVTGTEADADGYVTVWPCGTPRPTASNLNLTAGTTSPNLVISKVGTGGRVCLYTQSPTHLIADLDGHFPATTAYTPLQPSRLLDTRSGVQLGYLGPKPAADQVVELKVTGAGASQLPADTAAVVLNVTGTDADADGYVTVWPCGTPRPTASNLNLTAGTTSPNLVISKVGTGGRVCLYTQSPTHLIADLDGHFPATSTFVAVQPERLLDTRAGDQVGYVGAEPGADAVVELQVTGAGASQLPADTAAVVLNVTGTEADADGYVTVWPCGTPRPTASNLNLTAGTTSPNLVISKVGTGGRVCLYTQSPTHLIADLDGHFPATTAYTPLQPSRLLDTRSGVQLGYLGPKPAADQVVELKVTGAGASQLPADTAAVVLNVTGTDADADGYVTVWPCGTPRPTASNLNLTAGTTSPNLVVSRVGAGGKVCLYTQSPTHLIADLAGSFF